MNIIMLVGGVIKEPEKVEGTNATLCKLFIAVNENFTRENGERPVQYFNVAVWGKLAENCLKYLHKGSKIGIVGKIQNRSWEQDGVKRYATEVVANEIEFITTPKQDKKDEQMTPIDDDVLPF